MKIMGNFAKTLIPCVDPAFFSMHSHLMAQLTFYLLKNMIFQKIFEVVNYFCFIFFKGKQNKKENLKCDSLFEILKIKFKNWNFEELFENEI